jgi:hypothetical protein
MFNSDLIWTLYRVFFFIVIVLHKKLHISLIRNKRCFNIPNKYSYFIVKQCESHFFLFFWQPKNLSAGKGGTKVLGISLLKHFRVYGECNRKLSIHQWKQINSILYTHLLFRNIIIESCNPTRPDPKPDPIRPADGCGFHIVGSGRLRAEHCRVGSVAGWILSGRAGCGFKSEIYRVFIGFHCMVTYAMLLPSSHLYMYKK